MPIGFVDHKKPTQTFKNPSPDGLTISSFLLIPSLTSQLSYSSHPLTLFPWPASHFPRLCPCSKLLASVKLKIPRHLPRIPINSQSGMVAHFAPSPFRSAYLQAVATTKDMQLHVIFCTLYSPCCNLFVCICLLSSTLVTFLKTNIWNLSYPLCIHLHQP
jgi:hypothetical protein